MYEAHEIQRGLEPADLTKFFIKLNDRNWQIKPEFRSKVTFQTSNLVESFAMLPTFDFISCRNVLIYFDDTTKMDIVKRLGDNLNKGGYLILGQVDYINCKIPPQGVSYKIADGFPYYIKDQA
jgi:chemotaxis protein methyltransferase CheR